MYVVHIKYFNGENNVQAEKLYEEITGIED